MAIADGSPGSKLDSNPPASANADQSSQSQPPIIIDDKSSHCIPFILSRLKIHQQAHQQTTNSVSSAESPSASSINKPFFIGLNGVQGAGKTTLVSTLAKTLREKEGLETLVCSIDDLYLTHEDQEKLARENPLNPLVQHRGEPGTHDMNLAQSLFTNLKTSSPVSIPSYDKSAFNGQGDRVPPSKWESINAASQPKVQVIIFEGWCVGFRALSFQQLSQKLENSETTKTLQKHRREDLEFVNEKLKAYDVMTDCFDAFIHIDAEETTFVYEWRLEQEAALRRDKGSGMTDEQVIKFVDGYYPAYELYTEQLREGVFKGKEDKGRQLRLVVGKDRRVKKVIVV